jgi:hypothetical protein
MKNLNNEICNQLSENIYFQLNKKNLDWHLSVEVNDKLNAQLYINLRSQLNGRIGTQLYREINLLHWEFNEQFINQMEDGKFK